MASGYGKKKTFGEKVKASTQKATGTLKKAFMATLAAGTLVGAPAWYYYGTIEEAEITVKSVRESYVGWDEKEEQGIYDYKIATHKELFTNENTYAHLKFDSRDMQRQFDTGKTYKITYYGKRFDLPFTTHDLYPNILSAREVTPAEIAEREKAKAKDAAQKNAPAQTPVAQPAVAGQQQPLTQTFGALSGRVVTYDLVTPDAKYTVQVTGPVEVAGKLTVNAVTPLQPPAPATTPRPPQL